MYCITEKHLTGDSMYLTEDVIRNLEKQNKAHCGMYVSSNGNISNGYKPGYSPCYIPFDEHTCDTVAFLQLTRNTDNIEVSTLLKNISSEIDSSFIDGFAFVETEENFRITNIETE